MAKLGRMSSKRENCNCVAPIIHLLSLPNHHMRKKTIIQDKIADTGPNLFSIISGKKKKKKKNSAYQDVMLST